MVHNPPIALSGYINDAEWSDRIERIVGFADMSLSRRLDFIEQFAHMNDWLRNVGFSSLLEPDEKATIIQKLKGAALDIVNLARTQLDRGDTDAAHSTYLRLMRTASRYCYENCNATRFGEPGHVFTHLGDIVTWKWAHA